MNRFLRWLGVLGLLVGLTACMSMAAGNTDLQDLCVGKNNSNCPYKIDASGNVTAAGNVTASAAILSGLTITQINALAPTAVGQMVYCTNCVESSICVSSGTASSQWTVIAATATTGPIGACK